MTGVVTLQLSAKSVGLFEAFYHSLKPITICDVRTVVDTKGKLSSGASEIPFEFNLEGLEEQDIYETYHGVYVNVQYTLVANLKAGWFGTNMTKNLEFMVENHPNTEGVQPVREVIKLEKEKVEAKKSLEGAIPEFSVGGYFETTNCNIKEPLRGAVIVEHCSEPIKSIELQLIRVETSGCSDGFAREATEIQNIQIADGDIMRNFEIPIYMTWPRLFTCPSLATPTFKIDFEIKLVVMFDEGRYVTEKYPLTLFR
eukprot:TRINITY_DN1310_c0_g1_i1.p1 TRINITY_DN1310_c0_g1~~TRINITY_DN1310_c0_g1_i1.p1  ORF type:complete len:299 (-),score=67.22 TRINITY_DN1310_c0_g1_i1:43-810(-)